MILYCRGDLQGPSPSGEGGWNPDKGFQAALIKRLQKTITDSFETNGKLGSLSKERGLVTKEMWKLPS